MSSKSKKFGVENCVPSFACQKSFQMTIVFLESWQMRMLALRGIAGSFNISVLKIKGTIWELMEKGHAFISNYRASTGCNKF